MNDCFVCFSHAVWGPWTDHTRQHHPVERHWVLVQCMRDILQTLANEENQ